MSRNMRIEFLAWFNDITPSRKRGYQVRWIAIRRFNVQCDDIMKFYKFFEIFQFDVRLCLKWSSVDGANSFGIHEVRFNKIGKSFVRLFRNKARKSYEMSTIQIGSNKPTNRSSHTIATSLFINHANDKHLNFNQFEHTPFSYFYGWITLGSRRKISRINHCEKRDNLVTILKILKYNKSEDEQNHLFIIQCKHLFRNLILLRGSYEK